MTIFVSAMTVNARSVNVSLVSGQILAQNFWTFNTGKFMPLKQRK